MQSLEVMSASVAANSQGAIGAWCLFSPPRTHSGSNQLWPWPRPTVPYRSLSAKAQPWTLRRPGRLLAEAVSPDPESSAAGTPPSSLPSLLADFDYDVVESLLLESSPPPATPLPPPPPPPRAQWTGGRKLDSLERKALRVAVQGSSARASSQERVEAMNSLLRLFQCKGVPTSYAFEFVLRAGDLMDELILQAKEKKIAESSDNAPGTRNAVERDCVCAWKPCLGNQNLAVACSDVSKALRNLETLKKETGNQKGSSACLTMLQKAEEESTMAPSSLSSEISLCAEEQGLSRLVYCLYLLNVRPTAIPQILPFVGGRKADEVIEKVDLLRRIGVKANQIPSLLSNLPQILSLCTNTLDAVAEYLTSLGLHEKEIGTIITKCPSILMSDMERELLPTVELLKELGIKDDGIKKLIVRHPSILTGNAQIILEPLVSFFENIGVKRKNIGSLLVQRPGLLNSNIEKDLYPVIEYLRSINASDDDIDKIITSFPWLFRYDVTEVFLPTVLQLQGIGINMALMGKIFRKHPRILKNRSKFESKLDFLLSLGLERDDLGKVISNAPQLLGLSIEKNLLPTVQFLESIGINGDDLIKVLKRKPMILCYGIDSKLRHNFDFLVQLGIEEESIKNLVARHPQLLALNVERNLEPTIICFYKLGFTREDILQMVRNLPSLLGFNVKNRLKPKYNYLTNTMKRSREEVVRFPHFFSYSLSKRIIPRYEALPSSRKLLSLSTIYGCADATFEKKILKWNAV